MSTEQTPPFAEKADLAEVIAQHRYGEMVGDYEIAPYRKFITCGGCDWRHDIAGMSGWRSWVAKHAEHVAEQVERVVTERVDAALRQASQRVMQERIVCPTHLIPDCSPLLNGCSTPNAMHATKERAAYVVRMNYPPERPLGGEGR